MADPVKTCSAAEQIKVYVINLDRAPERMRNMTEELESVHLPFERIPAIDGRDIDLKTADRRTVNEKRYLFCHGKRFNPNELGCYLSHYRAIETFFNSGAAFGLILEDDICFESDFRAVLDALIHCAGEWDAAKLSGRHSGWPVPQRKLTENRTLVTLLTRHTGAGAYLINRDAAKRYLDRLLPMFVPYDHAFDKEWIFGFKFRGVNPPPVQAQTAGDSTIGDGFNAVKNKWYRRGSVFLYRLQNETRRAFNALIKGYWIPRAVMKRGPNREI